MRKRRMPNTYVIIATLLAISAVATWLVPGGKPQTWQVFTSIYHGFVKQAGIIIFILVVGGAFSLLNATGAVSSGINRFICRFGKRDKLILAALTVLFSLAGAVFGMSEETIPFIGIVVPLAVSMGYDAIMGMLVVYVASNVGFSSAFLNPFTVGIAQEMAELPPFSGMGYRVFCWALLTVLLVIFVLVYAGKTRREPAAGAAQSLLETPLTRRHAWILAVLFVTVGLLVYGVTCRDWYMPEITGLFLLMGLVCGVIAGFSANRIADELIAGAKDILSAALIVGFASGIIIILQDGGVIDSLFKTLQDGLDGTGPLASLSAMYGIQALINFLLPSATAKAAITIPVMAPFSDMVGVSRQATVLAFQFGDGFTNMLTPTSGVLIAALAMAKVPYTRWVKWIWKMVLVLLVLGLLLLIPTVLFPIEGF
ncbi:MAG: YfcC family protein [Bacteroidales bacterium]|nr:YfcC family protein [Bacteroidales bacterium]